MIECKIYYRLRIGEPDYTYQADTWSDILDEIDQTKIGNTNN